ncbi:MAG: glutaredoxin 3 [Euryarchaeota archaeon]|nr:glutaredoxin 3 [Euryarchaeota archaeon]MBT3676396.1 glutaredoxin 3 [Candidatus Neomarinimicrobiota bacterium]MBT7150158.1 glutaredoxin 3 [Thiotrichales bacterium]MBT3757748.1 glutaredoxin 3 [Euryarchaeota archaeon]MBT4050833.1 glutaredoxin 3 [Euryarchaeota archaeon]
MAKLHQLLDETKTDFLVFRSTLCPYCGLAKRMLKGKRMSFTEINFDIKPEWRSIVVNETGHRTVPMIFDLREGTPIFVGGSDNLQRYLK